MDSGTIYEYSYEASSIEPDVLFGAGFFIVFIFIYAIIGLAIYIATSILLSKVFKKAGVDTWKAWVPFLNTWKMLEIGGQQGFWAVLSIIPLVNIASVVFSIIAIHNINLKLGYDIGMTILAIFLPIVWLIILALSKNPWNESLGAPRLDTPTTPPAGVSEAVSPQQFQAPAPQQASVDTPKAPIQSENNQQPPTNQV